ncbi:MAG: hypothetical protein IJZ73_05950 [Clostridia bacterium]|nr:hypothetical protein [Clostridia bacterium]
MIDWIVERLLEGRNNKKNFIRVLRKERENRGSAKIISMAKPRKAEIKRSADYIASLYAVQEKPKTTVLHGYFADIEGIK